MLPERIRELVEMHRYMRPAGSAAEAAFCARYLDNLPGVVADRAGNRMAVIGEDPTVLWSSHTDTVHKLSGQQRLVWGGDILTTHPNEKGGCLGADCTVGVWIMREMYRAGVPGLYIWHAAEEVGGKGSNYIATETPGLLHGIQCAIAFDRKGTKGVITRQWSGRTASDAFAASLAAQLPPGYAADDGGTFTDTDNYAALVPECTNLSVGYYAAHTQAETLNTAHAVKLLDAMLALDVDALTIAREPGDFGVPMRGGGWYTPDDHAGFGGSSSRRWTGYDEQTEIADLLWERPQEVAALLISLGYTRAGLEDDIDLMTHAPDPVPQEDEDELTVIRLDAARERAAAGL